MKPIIDFWTSWKGKTKFEIKAIKAVQKALRVLFLNIPPVKLRAIYIKGSFVRREMNLKSDVDIVPITYGNAILQEVMSLQNTQGILCAPAELLPHSLKEFAQGKRYTKFNRPKAGVDVTLRNLHNYKCIYGKPINISRYPMRSDLQFLQGHITAFDKHFLPMYGRKELCLDQIIKQVFHLVEHEERVQGREPPYSWTELAASIPDPRHIVHHALQYRLNPTKNTTARFKLIEELQKYLDKLRHKYMAR